MKNLLLVGVLLLLSILVCRCGSDSAVMDSRPPAPTESPDPDAPSYPTGFKKVDSGHGLATGAPFINADHVGELPVAFDWKNLGYSLPIRNQGQCGSCWAFSTIRQADYASKIFLGKEVLFSEQQVVANNYYGCGGGDFAGKWLMDHGAVLDADCPYTASNRDCKGSPKIAQRFIGWANVGASNRKPTVEELKLAILQFGPLSGDVAANSRWNNYSGGTMKGCGAKGINHMIVITGWDPDGNWDMDNQWGEGWGDAGTAKMPFGCDSIASDAAYMLIKPAGQYSPWQPNPQK